MMIKVLSFFMVAMMNVSLFANEPMPTNVGTPGAPTNVVQDANSGMPMDSGMGLGSGNGMESNGPMMGKNKAMKVGAKREPARRHKKKHRKHNR